MTIRSRHDKEQEDQRPRTNDQRPTTTLERISKMPQEDDGGCQLDHPEEVVRIAFPTRDDATEVVVPGKEPFDFPAPTSAAQRPAVLRARPAMRQMRRDQL